MVEDLNLRVKGLGFFGIEFRVEKFLGYRI